MSNIEKCPMCGSLMIGLFFPTRIEYHCCSCKFEICYPREVVFIPVQLSLFEE